MGVVSLYFAGGKILVLQDCFYIPNVRRNLISFLGLDVMDFQLYLTKNLFLLNMMLMRSVVKC